MPTKEEKELSAMTQALAGVMLRMQIANKLGVDTGRVTKLTRGQFRISPGRPVNDRIVSTIKQLYNQHFPGIKPTWTPPNESESAIAKKNVPTKLPSEEKAALQPQAHEKPVILSETTARNVVQEKISQLSIDLLTLPIESQQKAIEAISILMLGFRARRAGLR